MKLLPLIMLFTAITAVSLSAQEKKALSPHMKVEATVDGVDLTVEYNAPSMRNRTIFGDLVPYDEIWRTGANDATKVTFASAASIEGQPIPAGTYSFFTIPGESTWTIIFNKKANQWGHYSYNPAEDALRVEVTPEALDESVETMSIEATDSGMMLKWSDVGVPVKIGK